jgi:hydroxymethylpyrimidine/phosphomethylpyrimidine kinase
MGAKNVVITGAEIKNKRISDFILEEENQYMISGKIIPKTNHGSGCNYSASLLVSVVNGKTLKESVKFSKQFTYNSIKNAKNLGRGVEITQIKNPDKIQIELSNEINKFIKIKNIYKNIPECQTNFVFSKIDPKSIKDVLGIAGRIVKTGNNIRVAGDLAYGGSKHVATALITMNKKYPEIRSAVNLKYNEETILKFRKTRLIISSYDRSVEPDKIKNKEGSSIEWGVKHAIKKLESPPDIIFHKGDFGKEAMIIVFAKTPALIIEKVSKLFI